MCGEVNFPTRNPFANKIFSIKVTVEPFPFVPATCMILEF